MQLNMKLKAILPIKHLMTNNLMLPQNNFVTLNQIIFYWVAVFEAQHCSYTVLQPPA